MKDVMLDFETFGYSKNACVVQVGACYFDRKTGEIGRMFVSNVDAASSVNAGATIDGETVYWWLAQSSEAIASITALHRRLIRDVWEELNLFLSEADQIWSHATFDFVILMETFKMLKMKPNFSYRAARDIRTLMDLAGIKKATASRDGIHHDALDDAKFQVKYCVEAFNILSAKS